MFDYKKYKKEMFKIIDQESDEFEKNSDSDEIDKKYLDMRYKLNKDNNIIFYSILKDAWGMNKYSLYIVDDKEDNVIVVKNDLKEDDEISNFTIEELDLEKVKKVVSSNDLYVDTEIALSPVMDGCINEIYFASNNNYKEIRSYNLWYWKQEDAMKENISTNEKKKYTKEVISLLTKIQTILKKYKINLKLDI